MKYSARLIPSLLLVAALTALGLTTARADDTETSSLSFSDPAKPGTLRIAVSNGDIRIRGTDTKQVTVRSDLKPAQPAQRKDGLRVLSSTTSYSFTEKNNVVTLAYGADSWPTGGSGDFDIAVPVSTCIVISSSLGGDIDIAGVTGDIEVKSLNGEVKLADIAGGTVVETMNGEVNCTVRALQAGKPISFTSMNGEVRLNLPTDLKANVQLRSHNGSILTDFDEKQLMTKTTSTGLGKAQGRRYGLSKEEAAQLKAQVKQAIRMGMDAAKEATRAAKEAMNEDGEKPEKPEKPEKDEDDSADVAPVPPVPPVAPLPPMMGGKLVSGTLNGGGPEIRVTTMNGDVTLRKIEEKK